MIDHTFKKLTLSSRWFAVSSTLSFFDLRRSNRVEVTRKLEFPTTQLDLVWFHPFEFKNL